MKIRPHLWYDTQAAEAAELYAATFPDSKITGVSRIVDTPSGDCDIVTFELWGTPFQAISAGPQFRFTPAISFLVSCDTAEQVDAFWATLAEGGKTLMPLDTYPFSERYGWTEDRYGLSWQVMLNGDASAPRIAPSLLFVGDKAGKAEEAMQLYTSVIPDSSIGMIVHHEGGQGPDAAGTVMFASFELAGQGFTAMDSAGPHEFGFNEAVSLMAMCDTQAEIDQVWSALSAVPEAEVCGWLKDRFGVSWQVVPAALDDMLGSSDDETRARVTQAFLQMKKFDVAELERAYRGA